MEPIVSTPGVDAALFLNDTVMPTLSDGLEAVLRASPKEPVTAIQEFLRQHNPMRATSRFQFDTRDFGKVEFFYRATPMDVAARMPKLFRRAGEHPVYGLDLVEKDILASVVKRLVEEEGVKHITWIVVGVDDVVAYVSGRPARATLSVPQWAALSSQCASKDVCTMEGAIIEAVRSTKEHGSGTVTSALNVISSVCADCNVPCTTRRLMHAPNVPFTEQYMDEVTSICADTPVADPFAVVVVAADRWSLVQHVQTTAAIYFRIQKEIRHIARLLRLVDQQQLQEKAVDVEAFEKKVMAKRAERDSIRQMLLEAHVRTLMEREEEESVEAMLKRDASKQGRIARRAREDAIRKDILTSQGHGAAVRVQSFVRGAMVRRRCPQFKRSKRSVEEAEILYREGRFPLVDMTVQYLADALGGDMILFGEAPKRAGTKTVTRWNVRQQRVAPIDDLDVSSDEEEWTSETVEKITAELQANFNPYLDAVAVVKDVGSGDIAYMFDLYKHYAGLSTLQRKAALTLERFVGYIMYAAYMTFYHKRKAAEELHPGHHKEVANANNENNDRMHLELAGAADESTEQGGASVGALRIPTKIQHCDTFASFVSVVHLPQEWINNAAWVGQFFSFQPLPLLCSRLLMGTDSPTGQAVAEGVPLLIEHPTAFPTVTFVAEAMTVPQWMEAASRIMASAKARRLTWIHTSPDLVVYVNHVPLYCCLRDEGHDHNSDLPSAASIRNAIILPERPPVDMEASMTMMANSLHERCEHVVWCGVRRKPHWRAKQLHDRRCQREAQKHDHVHGAAGNVVWHAMECSREATSHGSSGCD